MGVRATGQFEVAKEFLKEPTGEEVVVCPVCKAVQTLTLAGDSILPTRKFTQIGNRVFHDCSTREPCRLYRIL